MKLFPHDKGAKIIKDFISFNEGSQNQSYGEPDPFGDGIEVPNAVVGVGMGLPRHHDGEVKHIVVENDAVPIILT